MVDHVGAVSGLEPRQHDGLCRSRRCGGLWLMVGRVGAVRIDRVGAV